LKPAPARAGNATEAGVAARRAASRLLSGVLDGTPLDSLIDPHAGDAAFRQLEPRDRALARAIVATALRRRGQILAALSRLMARGLPPRSGRLQSILETAAAQILFLDVPAYAVVSTAMADAEGDRHARHFKPLINGVLRRLARERDASLAVGDAGRVNTPAWLYERWAAAYGDDTARKIAAAHLVEPGLDLTVKNDAQGWAEKLGGIALPNGSVRLVPSGPVEMLPGYAEGEWWVQNAAAALPVRLLGAVTGKRVADLCAAPGGKTAALALAGAEVTAVDVSAGRLQRLAANLARLKLAANLVTADVLTWTPAEEFDAVLLDAPCSATGTIRRHPDIPWIKRPDDIAALADLQLRMIERAIALLKPGGILVYCTCSLEPEEGEAQLARLRAAHDELRPVPVEADELGGLAEALTPEGAVRTLPCHLPNAEPRLAGLDGFFIARLRKDRNARSGGLSGEGRRA
jgi:16S rRNA (cytosine967-C5)-methyltransferase